MYKIILISLLFSMVACNNNDTNNTQTEITLEQALEGQQVNFTITDISLYSQNDQPHEITLTTDDFENSGYNHHYTNIENIEYNQSILSVFTRSIYIGLPENQTNFDACDTIGFIFNKIEFQNNLSENNYITNQLFRENFIETGIVNNEMINISYDQCYHPTNGFEGSIIMKITEISIITNHENKIFVTGEFNGVTNSSNDIQNNLDGFKIENGTFAFILEN